RPRIWSVKPWIGQQVPGALGAASATTTAVTVLIGSAGGGVGSRNASTALAAGLTGFVDDAGIVVITASSHDGRGGTARRRLTDADRVALIRTGARDGTAVVTSTVGLACLTSRA